LAWNDRKGESGLGRDSAKRSRSNASHEDLVIDVDKHV